MGPMRALFVITLFIIPFQSNQEVDCEGQNPCSCDASLGPQDTCTLICDKDGACTDSQLQCYSGSLCSIECTATEACLQATLVSNGATDIDILCFGNKESDECKDTIFECGAGSCSLNCGWGGKDVSCSGVAITFVADTTSFACAPTTNCPTAVLEQEFTPSPTSQPTSSPTQYPSLTPTKNPSLAPIKDQSLTPTKDPTLTPSQNPTITRNPTAAPITADPTASPTANPSMSPNIQSQEVVEEAISTTTVSDNASMEDTEGLTGNMTYVIVGVSCMCCCVIAFVLCFDRRKKKKEEMIEVFSTTFGSKKDGTREPVTPDQVTSRSEKMAENTPPAATATQMEEYRKGTDTVTLEKMDAGTFGTATTSSLNTEPFTNTYLNKEVLNENNEHFADVIQNTTVAEDLLMDDIVSDMMTPGGPEPVMAEVNENVFQTNEDDILMCEDEGDEEYDDDNDVIEDMVTPQLQESNDDDDDDDDDVLIGMNGPTLN